MRRVVIESPYSAPTAWGVRRNVTYLRACLRDSLRRGEAPFASHGLYTLEGVLDDRVEAERAQGMIAGWAWLTPAAIAADVVYCNLGISGGMMAGILCARRNGVILEFRKLKDWKDPYAELVKNMILTLPEFRKEEDAEAHRLATLGEELRRLGITL